MRRTARTARKRHHCDGIGGEPCGGIKPGDRYVESVAPPDWDGLGNLGWWRLRFCAEHAQQYPDVAATLGVPSQGCVIISSRQ